MTLGQAFSERWGMPAGRPTIDRRYTPFSGPQAAFDHADEYEVLFGGAKGPGKSHAALYKPLRHVHLPLFKALFLRVDFPSLRENMDRAHRVFPQFGATWNEQEKRYTFPSGATYEFGYAETLKDIRRYQGREPSTLVYDEIGQLADENVWTTLLAELRSPDPTIPRQAVATANPGGPGEPWLIRRFVKACGEDGSRVYTDPVELSLTRRFIPARVTDNPIYANDAKYMATLRALPNRKRQQLLEGQWGIGEGRGLEELDERRHIVKPFEIPGHWTVWGAFDWGYAHPFAFGWFAQDEDGTVYLIDSIHGHRMLPWEQAAKIQERAPERAKAMVWAGHDCWNETKARGENTPTIAETFKGYGILLRKANISRVTGLNNMREYIKWQGPGGVTWKPRFFLFDTPGNRRTFEVLESMMTDPDDPEDVLKRDADGDTGEGGDDEYDMCLSADTLVITEAGPRPIASLVGTSGKCLTPLGWKRYNAVRITRQSAPLVRAETTDGVVIGTADHEVLTPGGWVQLGRLAAGDRWTRAVAPDRDIRGGTGVREPALLAERGGLHAPPDALPPSRGVRGELRTDPAAPSNPPQGRQPGEQPTGESGSDSAEGAFEAPLDAGTPSARGTAHGGNDATASRGVASFGGRTGMALAERPARHGRAGESGESLRAMRNGVQHDSDARPVLLKSLQVEVAPIGWTGRCDASVPDLRYAIHGEQVRSAGDVLEALRAAPAIVTRIEPAGVGPTYNMEVEDAHCFAVMGGLVVHNCRYGLASRPVKTRTLPVPDSDEITPAMLAAEAERQRRIDWRKKQRKQRPLDPNYGEF